MPVPALKSLVEKSKTDKTLADAERYWDEAKEMAKEKGFSEGDERFYKYVMGIVKRRLSVADFNISYIKLAQFLNAEQTREKMKKIARFLKTQSDLKPLFMDNDKLSDLEKTLGKGKIIRNIMLPAYAFQYKGENAVLEYNVSRNVLNIGVGATFNTFDAKKIDIKDFKHLVDKMYNKNKTILPQYQSVKDEEEKLLAVKKDLKKQFKSTTDKVERKKINEKIKETESSLSDITDKIYNFVKQMSPQKPSARFLQHSTGKYEEIYGDIEEYYN